MSKLEVTSTTWEKVRTREITELEAQTTVALIDSDFEKYTFVAIDSLIIEQARRLFLTYRPQGLRTLDSIQLSMSVSLAQQADLFLTSDKLLQSFMEAEGLLTEMPRS